MTQLDASALAQQLSELSEAWAKNRANVETDRRSAERKPYPCMQRIGAFKGEIPAWDNLQEVRCHDLSTTGFSFFTPTMPSRETIVAVFGSETENVVLLAQVRYVKRVAKGETNLYLVGCKFLRKLN